MIKVLITDGMASNGVEILNAESTLKTDLHKGVESSDLLKLVADIDCIVVRSATTVTKEVIDHAKNLKLICRAGAGVDNVDVPAATARGIAVMNTASANSLAAAEHAIAHMMALMRHIPQAHQSMTDKKWDKKSFVGREVTGKTLGILGLGNIGKLVAERGLGLKMNVIAFDPFFKDDSSLPADLKGKVKILTSLDEVLKKSDIVTLHLPVNKDTRGLLNMDRLSTMKDGAYLINCARGGIVDETILPGLLDSGKLSGVAFDVFDKEPIEHPHTLIGHPKAIVTPHLGASTHEAQERVALTAATQIVGFFTKGDRTGVLN